MRHTDAITVPATAATSSVLASAGNDDETVGALADRNRGAHASASRVDHGDLIGATVRGVECRAIGRECDSPGTCVDFDGREDAGGCWVDDWSRRYGFARPCPTDQMYVATRAASASLMPPG